MSENLIDILKARGFEVETDPYGDTIPEYALWVRKGGYMPGKRGRRGYPVNAVRVVFEDVEHPSLAQVFAFDQYGATKAMATLSGCGGAAVALIDGLVAESVPEALR